MRQPVKDTKETPCPIAGENEGGTMTKAGCHLTIVGPGKQIREHSPDLAAAKKIAHDTTVRLVSKSRLAFDGEPDRWSGVIVAEEGHILTCGHTDQLPGEQVTVRLSDGRDFNGVVLGTNPVSDVGLVKITDSGTWPFAEIVDSSLLAVGDPVVTCGYPGMSSEGKPSTNRNPVVTALAVRRQRPYLLWRNELPMTRDGFRRGGMSGGGVFDSKGHYVGVFLGSEATRSEVAKVQWTRGSCDSMFRRERTTANRARIQEGTSMTTPETLQELARQVRRDTLAILDAERCCSTIGWRAGRSFADLP